ncbi:DUF4145 domain-containing protein [Pseudonocardia dioxanivorans]|uniref:DUF4145 domain-containing protein n=1 Tax=Pseudonocardia dioxanivorans TaxID=240495 RepID=UPI0018F8B7C5|nr:DUF4145 domain-containing protein [Pseudonocardia dioxanivorans]
MSDEAVLVTFCPVCSGRTQFTETYQGEEVSPRSGWYYVAVECAVCNLLLTGKSSGDGEFRVNNSGRQIQDKQYPDVPEHIGSAASEAHRSMVANCYRGAVILARAVIEATAKNNGITSGNIASKIEKMQEQGLIRPYVREGADEVRIFGNDMAHGDFVDEVGEGEVTLALELMDEVLTEVYEGPARVERAKARKRDLAGKAQVRPTAPAVRSGAEIPGRS